MHAKRFAMIAIDRIHPNPYNPRQEAGDVSELAVSIRENGLLQNLLVREDEFNEGMFILLDGYRRWVASRQVLVEVPCDILLVGAVGPIRDAVQIGLITDIHKTNLTGMERGWAYGRLRDECGMTQEQIAAALGCSVSTVSRYQSLLELSDGTQKKVYSGQISAERAIEAVAKHRKKSRETGAPKKPVDLTKPDHDHFSPNHHLANKAKVMCDAREHDGRRRFAGACHACWETVIRQDESTVQKTSWETAGMHTPFLAPISPDGAIRTDATLRANGNGHVS